MSRLDTPTMMKVNSADIEIPIPVYIGIDPGVDTGVAVVIGGRYVSIQTMGIIKAMQVVSDLVEIHGKDHLYLYVENPNLRKYFGDKGRDHLQGAGSIKRDYSVWEEYIDLHGLHLMQVAPQSVGSMFNNVTIFKSATGWTGRTSVHARDAAKMVYRFVKM